MNFADLGKPNTLTLVWHDRHERVTPLVYTTHCALPAVKFTLSHKLFLLVAVPLISELLFLGVLASVLQKADVAAKEDAHARAVSAHLNSLLRLMLERGASSAIWHLASDNAFRERFHRARIGIRQEIAGIRGLVADRPVEARAFSDIDKQCDGTVATMAEAQQFITDGEPTKAVIAYKKLRTELEDVFKSIDELFRQEEIIRDRAQQALDDQRHSVELITWLGAAASLLTATALTLYLLKGITSRLQVVTDNAMRLVSQQPFNEPVKGSDEIAEADRIFREVGKILVDMRERERANTEQAVEVICSIDKQGKFVDVNAACQVNWGFLPADLIGKRVVDILIADDSQRTLEQLRDAARSNEVAFVETRVKRHNGTIADTIWSVRWAEKEEALFCVVHDITERKRIEQLKQDFVAMVSHDLKTPLTTIQMVHSLFEANAYGVISAEGQHSLQMAQESTERLIRLVNNLLDIEKLESGTINVQIEDISVSQVVQSSLSSVFATAENKGITVKSSVSPDLRILGDEERLVQVVVNLLSNAIKFSNKGDSIQVEAEVVGTMVEFAVKDEGRGVPENLQEAIFEKFKQVERSDETKKGGTGLGLAICKAIVERHGGKIGVRSKPGQGSTFWFQIPAALKANLLSS